MELPGRCGDWLDTATVTAQGLSSRSTRRARGGDLHLAISGDFSLATSGDFGMAADNIGTGGKWHRRTPARWKGRSAIDRGGTWAVASVLLSVEPCSSASRR